jgi:hypothetical protein
MKVIDIHTGKILHESYPEYPGVIYWVKEAWEEYRKLCEEHDEYIMKKYWYGNSEIRYI